MFFIIIFITCSKPGLALKSHPAKRTSSLTGMPAYLVSIAYKVRSYFSLIFIFLKIGEPNKDETNGYGKLDGEKPQGLNLTQRNIYN